jgi:FixJ family two-component response regulator
VNQLERLGRWVKASFGKYTDLLAYRTSFRLSKEIFEVTKQFPKEEKMNERLLELRRLLDGMIEKSSAFVIGDDRVRKVPAIDEFFYLTRNWVRYRLLLTAYRSLLTNMSEAEPTVFVIDDDAPMRVALMNLIRSVGLRAELFASAQEFLRSKLPNVPSCLILDVRLPGLSGLDLQRRTTEAGMEIPIIFISGYGDIPMTVRAMKAGAVEFLTKPFRDQDLLDAIQQALERDRQARDQRAATEELRRRFASLTPREREVMARVVAGLLNKQIGAELGTSHTTVKIHRHQVMEKMGAGSLPELVRMADKLGIRVPRS